MLSICSQYCFVFTAVMTGVHSPPLCHWKGMDTSKDTQHCPALAGQGRQRIQVNTEPLKCSLSINVALQACQTLPQFVTRRNA